VAQQGRRSFAWRRAPVYLHCYCYRVMLLPLAIAISTSLKPIGEVYADPPSLLPHVLHVELSRSINQISLLHYLLNTLLVVCMRCWAAWFLHAGAYGFARYKNRWSGPLFMLMLST